MVDANNIGLVKIIKRLEMIKSLIVLEEEDEIRMQISKLEKNIILPELRQIIYSLNEKSFSKAVVEIDAFIKQHHSLAIYIDPELIALKLEIKSLEAAIGTLSYEKAELEKLIHEFGIRHNNELGELILKLLRYRRENLKGSPQQQEAEDDFNNYSQEYQATKNNRIEILTFEEQKELRDKYRKASKLCHPDVVNENQMELATKLFADLSIAYENNDIERVRAILKDLEAGKFFITKSDSINEKRLLEIEMERQRLKIKELGKELKAIKESETYKTISRIDNWDDYFNKTKLRLQDQVNEIESAKS